MINAQVGDLIKAKETIVCDGIEYPAGTEGVIEEIFDSYTYYPVGVRFNTTPPRIVRSIPCRKNELMISRQRNG